MNLTPEHLQKEWASEITSKTAKVGQVIYCTLSYGTHRITDKDENGISIQDINDPSWVDYKSFDSLNNHWTFCNYGNVDQYYTQAELDFHSKNEEEYTKMIKDFAKRYRLTEEVTTRVHNAFNDVNSELSIWFNENWNTEGASLGDWLCFAGENDLPLLKTKRINTVVKTAQALLDKGTIYSDVVNTLISIVGVVETMGVVTQLKI